MQTLLQSFQVVGILDSPVVPGRLFERSTTTTWRPVACQGLVHSASRQHQWHSPCVLKNKSQAKSDCKDGVKIPGGCLLCARLDVASCWQESYTHAYSGVTTQHNIGTSTNQRNTLAARIVTQSR